MAPRKGSRQDLLRARKNLENGHVLETRVETLKKNNGGSWEYYQENGIRYVGKIEESDLPNENEMQRLLDLLLSDKAETIFDQDIEVPAHRRQYVVGDDELNHPEQGKADITFLNRTHISVISKLPTQHCKTQLTILFSPENSDVIQIPHQDLMDPSKKRKINATENYLLLVAIEDNTTFIVYYKSHFSISVRPESTRYDFPHRIILSRGDVLQFHPLVKHAGDNYIARNIRLHYYVLSLNSKFENLTGIPTKEEVQRMAGEKQAKLRRAQIEGRSKNHNSKNAKNNHSLDMRNTKKAKAVAKKVSTIIPRRSKRKQGVACEYQNGSG